MIVGRKIEGLVLARIRLDGTSNTTYWRHVLSASPLLRLCEMRLLLERTYGDEEHDQCDRVLVRVHVEVFGHARDLCIADVGSLA
jgi:hypothetical protein